LDLPSENSELDEAVGLECEAFTIPKLIPLDKLTMFHTPIEMEVQPEYRHKKISPFKSLLKTYASIDMGPSEPRAVSD